MTLAKRESKNSRMATARRSLATPAAPTRCGGMVNGRTAIHRLHSAYPQAHGAGSPASAAGNMMGAGFGEERR
jgi:hypothetical protein